MQGAPADVIIIGSGAGGAACAWALCQRGIRVLILEAGPRFDPYRDYALHQQEWERRGFPEPMASTGRYSFGNLQTLDPHWKGLRSWDHISGEMNKTARRLGAKYHHVRGVGGSTLHFTGEAHRLNPDNMRMHSRFGVAADWPMTYQELEPYYEQAEKLIGVASGARPFNLRSTGHFLPPHAPGYASQKIIDGCRHLGLRWMPNTLATLSQPYDGRPGCNYCANCNRGCPRKDKGSADVTFIDKALRSGYCTVLPQSEALRVNTKNNDTVGSVDYVDHTGKLNSQSTRVVVVACGAVQTPRLLLLSASTHAPDGLANDSGEVGKHFMETLSWNSAGLHSENIATYRGLPSDIICWDYNRPDAIPNVIGGCRFAPSTAEANLIGPLNYAKRVVKGWGKQHKIAMRNNFGKVLSIAAMGESIPNPKSFIDLDPRRIDDHGQAIARIHSHLEQGDLQRLQFMADKTREILQAVGVEKLFEEYGSYDYFNSTHVFGGARMGNDAETSVVNAHGRSHRWKNLFITDASVFPSSGGGESPSLTIEALAIRTSEQICDAMVKKVL